MIRKSGAGQSFALGDEGKIILHRDSSLLGTADSQINAAIAGEPDRIGDYAYPDNEIGRLAEGEIHARAREEDLIGLTGNDLFANDLFAHDLEQGRVTGHFGVQSDITGRRRAVPQARRPGPPWRMRWPACRA